MLLSFGATPYEAAWPAYTATFRQAIMVFLGAAWNGGSVLTDYMCAGASVWVLTGEVPVINSLLVGTPTNFSMPFVKAGFLTTFHRVWEHDGAPGGALRGGFCIPRTPGSHCF